MEYKDQLTKQILRVELQVRKTYRDEYCNVIRHETWVPVERAETFVHPSENI
jgi:hypothetical protein